ncbi:hypothetical protein SDC9_160232 [bioreactor metagenome]|uniref:Uncharacterized protein n=1 Tax=bioreactor metagenome TaxID=1076179 RepID=A0A645FHC1_9ZZZZ
MHYCICLNISLCIYFTVLNKLGNQIPFTYKLSFIHALDTSMQNYIAFGTYLGTLYYPEHFNIFIRFYGKPGYHISLYDHFA